MGFKLHAIKTYGEVEVCGHPLELQQEVTIRAGDSSVGVVAKPWGGLPRNRGSIRGVFRPRQTRQLPRAVDLKGRLLSCQSY